MNTEKCNTVGVIEASVRNKHEELAQAISDSNSVYQRIMCLVGRIEGSEGPEVTSECEPDVKQSTPSLKQVLCNGTGDIRQSTNLAHDAISVLEEMLF